MSSNDFIDEKQKKISEMMMQLNKRRAHEIDTQSGLFGGAVDSQKAYQMGRVFGDGMSGSGFTGGSFWSDFADGFMSVVKPVASVAKVFMPPAASKAMEAVGLGKPKKEPKLLGVQKYNKDNPENLEELSGGNSSVGLIEKVEKDGKTEVKLPPVANDNPKRVLKLLTNRKKMEGGRIEMLGNDNLSGGAQLAGGATLGAPKVKGGRKLIPKEEMKPTMMSGGKKEDNKEAPKKKGNRAEIVRKIMKEKGMKLIEASKYVKQNGLY